MNTPLQQRTAGVTSQTDLGQILLHYLRKNGMTMKRFREEHLADDEWWQDEGGKIRWHAHAIEKLMVFLEEPKVVSRFIDVRVIKPAINKKYAVCAHEGKRIYVVVPRKLQKRIRRGIPLRVEVIEDVEGQRSYREQSLAVK